MLVFSNKAIRLLLAASVSIWMAGGCLFGCANTTMGAEVKRESHSAIEAAPSCHAHRSHDGNAAKPPNNFEQQLASVPSFVPDPSGTMAECPLVVSSTAATSKNSTHLPDPARGADPQRWI